MLFCRHTEFQGREEAGAALQAALSECRTRLQNISDDFSHIPQDKKDAVLADVEKLDIWFQEKMRAQQLEPKYGNILVTVKELEDEKKRYGRNTIKIDA